MFQFRDSQTNHKLSFAALPRIVPLFILANMNTTIAQVVKPRVEM